MGGNRCSAALWWCVSKMVFCVGFGFHAVAFGKEFLRRLRSRMPCLTDAFGKFSMSNDLRFMLIYKGVCQNRGFCLGKNLLFSLKILACHLCFCSFHSELVLQFRDLNSAKSQAGPVIQCGPEPGFDPQRNSQLGQPTSHFKAKPSMITTLSQKTIFCSN